MTAVQPSPDAGSMVLDFRLAAGHYQQGAWSGVASRSQQRTALDAASYDLAFATDYADRRLPAASEMDASAFETLRTAAVLEAPRRSIARWCLNRIRFVERSPLPVTTFSEFLYAWTEHRKATIDVHVGEHCTVGGPPMRHQRIASNAAFAAFLLAALPDARGGSERFRQLGAAGLFLPVLVPPVPASLRP